MSDETNVLPVLPVATPAIAPWQRWGAVLALIMAVVWLPGQILVLLFVVKDYVEIQTLDPIAAGLFRSGAALYLLSFALLVVSAVLVLCRRQRVVRIAAWLATGVTIMAIITFTVGQVIQISSYGARNGSGGFGQGAVFKSSLYDSAAVHVILMLTTTVFDLALLSILMTTRPRAGAATRLLGAVGWCCLGASALSLFSWSTTWRQWEEWASPTHLTFIDGVQRTRLLLAFVAAGAAIFSCFTRLMRGTWSPIGLRVFAFVWSAMALASAISEVSFIVRLNQLRIGGKEFWSQVFSLVQNLGKMVIATIAILLAIRSRTRSDRPAGFEPLMTVAGSWAGGGEPGDLGSRINIAER